MTGKMKNRLTNIYMYLGMISTILLATGLDIASLGNWNDFFTALMLIFQSPSKLLCLVLAILSALIDPTTKGITDKHNVTDKHNIIETVEKPVSIEENNNTSNDREENE